MYYLCKAIIAVVALMQNYHNSGHTQIVLFHSNLRFLFSVDLYLTVYVFEMPPWLLFLFIFFTGLYPELSDHKYLKKPSL